MCVQGSQTEDLLQMTSDLSLWCVKLLSITPFFFYIIIIIIIILVSPITHGIYNYVPETNHVSRLCGVAAVLYLQSARHVMLFRQ
jgi:hypothetical protein